MSTRSEISSYGVIPPCVHFCWIGTVLPWAYAFAVLSAAARSGFTEILLHHTDELADTPQIRALRDAPGVRLCRIDPVACLADAGAALGVGDQLVVLYRGIASPVMRTDVLRAAILYQRGGIYLDLDTVTVADLHPLRQATQFVGTEFIVWPQAVRSSRSIVVRGRSIALGLLRKALRWLPGGWILFRKIEHFYFRGINNAIMGAQAGSPLFAAYLRAMLTVPLDGPANAYAFGPHLLQQVAADYRQRDLTIHAPQVFYPLPPEISEHWFRIGRSLRLETVLAPDTLVVHWYASVRTKSRIAQITPGYIRDHHHDQLYSMLVSACVPNLPSLT